MTIDVYCHCYHCVPGGGQLLSLLLLLSLSLSIVRLLSSFIYNFVTYHFGRPAAALRRLLQDLDADRGTVQAKLTMARKIKWNDYFAQVVTTISVPCQLQPSRSVRAHDAGVGGCQVGGGHAGQAGQDLNQVDRQKGTGREQRAAHVDRALV